MTILDEIQTSIRRHAKGVGSSVVGIGQRRGVGWGIVLAGGRVLTNAHNVHGDQVTVTLQGAPGGAPELRVVRGADERTVQVVFTREIEGQ